MNKSANLPIFVPHEGCPNRCVFCNQGRITGSDNLPTPETVRDICERYLPENGTGVEIAFFGGSFTAIEREYMVSLLKAAYPFVQGKRADGIRISTRPDAIDSAILEILAKYGVSAIELGAQSMDDSVLATNKRGHTAEQVHEASKLIKGAGFSLGLQMMVGMHGETDAPSAAEYTAREIAALEPDTVRIYPTVVVDDTELCDLYGAGKFKPLELEQAVSITAGLMTVFENAGISVIRAGLHSDEAFMKNVIAGPFHPAFGEMCYSLIMRGKVAEAIKATGRTDKLIVVVNPRDISRAVGYKKENIVFFKKSGLEVRIVPDSEIKTGDVVIRNS